MKKIFLYAFSRATLSPKNYVGRTKFTQVVAITFFCFAIFITILSCTKESPVTNPQDDLVGMSQNAVQGTYQENENLSKKTTKPYFPPTDTAKGVYDLTEKVNKVFPVGITKIQQFKSGTTLGIEKSKLGQKFVLINNGKTYYPELPPEVYKSVIMQWRHFCAFGIIHWLVTIGNCDYYYDIDEKTGEIVSKEKWCS